MEKKWNGKRYDLYNNIAYELKDGKGLVKEYHFNGRLKFEGEYINGERNGKGREYDKASKLIFEGEYLKGKKRNMIEKKMKNLQKEPNIIQIVKLNIKVSIFVIKGMEKEKNSIKKED